MGCLFINCLQHIFDTGRPVPGIQVEWELLIYSKKGNMHSFFGFPLFLLGGSEVWLDTIQNKKSQQVPLEAMLRLS